MSNYLYMADFAYQSLRPEVLNKYKNLTPDKKDKLNKGISKVRIKPISEKIKLRDQLAKNKDPMLENKIISRLKRLNEITDKSDDAFRNFREEIASSVNKKPTIKKGFRLSKAGIGVLNLGVLGSSAYLGKKFRDSRSDKGKTRGNYNG